MTKNEACEKLAEDYADRASRGGMKYTDAYDQYFKRCLSRELKDLLDQVKVQGLNKDMTMGFIV